MDNKLRNREIRRISSSSTLPILIFTVVTIIGEILLRYIVNNAEAGSILTKSVFQYILIQIIIYPILMPILYLVFYKYRGKSKNMRLKQTLVKPRRSVGWCLKWIIISIGVSQIAGRILTEIIRLFAGLFGVTPSDNSFIVGSGLIANIVMMTGLVVFAPVLEELLFRGIVCRNNEEMGQWFAVIISGVIFGLWHTNYAQLGFASVFGITLGIMYVKTRSIIPTMITHFINNLLVGVLTICRSIIMPAFNSGDYEYVFHYLFVKNIVVTILLLITFMLVGGIIIAGIVLLIIEIVKRRKSHKMRAGRFEMSALKKTLVYFSSPVTVVTFLLMIIMTVKSVFSFRIV